ncbi:MAG: FAD-dependent oxidoreductase [Chloroflexi bacterium]|nr:FAD-dependent oxidoreductase [Chloroflexota bacterium]
MSERPSVLVVGGGLAGIAAACELADAGLRVTLVEKRPFLGGRAYSYVDRRSGLEVDNGQHVFLGCCTQYIRLLKRLGVWHKAHLQRQMRVRVIDKVWGESVLESGALPPPLHLLPSLLRFRSLSPTEKARAAYAMARIRSLDREARPGLDDVTFADWLRAHGQTENAIRGFWNLIVLPTLNGDIDTVSADLALMVFQEGFLRDRNGANVGWARVGLSVLLAEAAREYIEARGGEVRLGERIAGLRLEDGRVATSGLDIDPEYLVLAVDARSLLPLLPKPLREEPFFGRIGHIDTSAIVNVHMWYDRQVTNMEFAAFLNTPLQWVFNKSRLWGQEGDGPSASRRTGQYLDVSLSGAQEFAEMPAAEIIRQFDREVQALFPAARTAELKRTLVVKQRHATFAARPGISRLRPGQRTPVGNLFLAGDWTATGWPATMESAVRSGLLAAREVLRRCCGQQGEQPPERRWLARPSKNVMRGYYP